jgi:hypothetical protein
VLSWRMPVGTSMPCTIMFVTHSRCGSGFFSTPRMLACSFASCSGVFTVRADVLDGAGEEAAGAAGRVEHDLAEARVHHVDGELRDGAGRVVLARVAGALEVAQDLLVDVAEEVAALLSLKSMASCTLLTTCRSSVPDFMYW